MTRNENAFVSFVFPFIVKVQEPVKQFLKLIAVVFNGFYCHNLTHVSSSGRVAYHAGTASDEYDRGMSKLLHVHHYYYLHKMAYMQAVGRRVKTDVELYLFLLKQFSYLLFIS